MPPPSNVSLLIGADTAITDESSYAKTLTVVGNAARTTAQSKFGGASLTFDGAGDWIQTPITTDLQFGSGDFTVEGWFRFVTKTNSQALLGQWDNGGTIALCSWYLYVLAGALTFRSATGAATKDFVFTWTPTLGQWYHIAVDRSGTTLRLYIDGVVVATNVSFTDTLNTASASMVVGAIGTSGGFGAYDYNGQMDEIRITKGLAQYNGAFTPPTGPFPRTSTEAWLSQIAVEAMSVPPAIAARLSQVAVETLVLPPSTTFANLSQAALEVLILPGTGGGGGGGSVGSSVWMGDGGGGSIWIE